MAEEDKGRRFVWTDADNITIIRKAEAKTDKVSMPNDDLWDNLVFEWIEE